MEEFNFTYTDGNRYVGGFIGAPDTRGEWLDTQITKWSENVRQLAQIAKRYPQTAFAGLSKSLQAEWQYLQRVTPNCKDSFGPIEEAIGKSFLPALLQDTEANTATLRSVLARSARHAGLGIPDPVASADEHYASSVHGTAILVNSIRTGTPLEVGGYVSHMNRCRVVAKTRRAAAEATSLEASIETALRSVKHWLLRAQKTSAWLTATPDRLNGTELSEEEFRDSLRLRYGLRPNNLPQQCDGCSARFSVAHALSCKRGGLIGARHNEVAAEWHQLCAQALTPAQVSDEPLIHTGQNPATGEGANRRTTVHAEERGDVAVRNFWKRGTTAIFDIRITDTEAPSQRGQDPAKVLEKHEKDKKDKYLQACLDRRRQFTPLVFSVDGMRGKEAEAAGKRLASLLAAKWKRPYSDVCAFVRSRLAMALVRATSLCIRGARDPTSHSPRPQWESGSGLRLYG